MTVAILVILAILVIWLRTLSTRITQIGKTAELLFYSCGAVHQRANEFEITLEKLERHMRRD